jgi:cyanophycinase
LSASKRAESSTRGILFAIGGRELRRGETRVLEAFIDRCGGPPRQLVVLTAASRDPGKRVDEYGPAFGALGVDGVSFFHQDNREQANDAAVLDAVAGADAVFLTGGNQLKLVSTLGGTRLEELLRTRHKTGLHIAGTSAGASAMSAVMIARGKGKSSPKLSSVRMAPGFGFLSRIIVDQHFRQRDRFGRLFAAVACNPGMLGMGLDEDTAFSLDRDDHLEVVGSGTLTIVDGAQLESTNIDDIPEDMPAAFAGLRLHVLTDGWGYDIRTREVNRPTASQHTRDVTGVPAAVAETSG